MSEMMNIWEAGGKKPFDIQSIYTPQQRNEAIKNRDPHFFVNTAKTIYENSDNRGDIQQMWSLLGTAWDFQSGRYDFDNRLFASPSELSLHGREWYYYPSTIQTNPNVLADYFPNATILKTRNIKNEASPLGYNYRVLAGGYTQTPEDPERPRRATLADYILANEASLSLTGMPLDPEGKIVSLLPGSRWENGGDLYARYTKTGNLELLTREEVIKTGDPVLTQYLRTDDSKDWPPNGEDRFTEPLPIT